MAHMITERDHAMYGRGKAAWHGLGTVIPDYATSDQAIDIARLGWTVRKEPAFVPTPTGFAAADDCFLTTRSDIDTAERVLGIVGPAYTPIQNRDMFDFLETLAGEGGAKIDTAGSLKGGRLVWALAKLPGAMMIQSDPVEKYILVSTSHDGSAAMEACITPIRVVCWNTLSAALWNSASEAKRNMHKSTLANGRPRPATKITIRHTANARQRIDDARRVLGTAAASFDRCAEVYNAWSHKPVSRQYVGAFLRALVPDPGNGAKPARAQSVRNDITELFRYRQIGADSPELRGTAWGLYNAMTQYIDRERSTRGSDAQATRESRLTSTWYGSGATLRQNAANLLLETLETYADFDDSRSVLDLVDGPPTPSILDGIEVATN